nr:unnamed protein product [Callosobruchus analis]
MDWKDAHFSRKELLREELDPQVLNKLMYALPTVVLARAFDPQAVTLSEKRYREIRVKMLDWPFCVSLLVGPSSLASRKEVCQELGGVSDDDSMVSRQRVTSRGKEESRLEALEKGQQEMREMIQALLKSSQRPGS